MHHSILKRLRTPIFSGVILILFAASSLLLSLSFAYRAYTRHSIAQAASQFTILAIPNDNNLWDSAASKRDPKSRSYMDSNSNIALTDSYLALYHMVQSSENAVLDRREYLCGVAKNAWPVLPRSFNSNYMLSYRAGYQPALLAVTCQSVALVSEEKIEELYGQIPVAAQDVIRERGFQGTSLYYTADLAIDEEILIHSAYAGQETIRMLGDAFTKEGNIPFEVGKRYIVRAYYSEPSLIQNPDYLKQVEKGNFNAPQYIWAGYDKPFLLPMYDMIWPGVVFSQEEMEANYSKTKLLTQTFEGKPHVVSACADGYIYNFMAPLTSDLDTFWAENPAWLSNKTRSLDKDARTLFVLTTDKVESLLMFQQKKTQIVAGRAFTEAELAGDVPACLISRNLAEANGLSVGDTLELDLSEAQFFRMEDRIENAGAMSFGDARGEIAPTIVGIFSAAQQNFGDSLSSLSVNTVIVPAALPAPGNAPPHPTRVADILEFPVSFDERGYEIFHPEESSDNIHRYKMYSSSHPVTIPDLFTAIIKPGKLEAFKAEAAAAKLSRNLLYSDQGFSALEGPIARLSETADTLFTLSLAVWGVLLIVLLILALRERRELGFLLSVGVRRKNAAWRLVFGWLAVLLPALLISGILASAGFDRFNRAVLGNLLTEREFNTRFSVGMTANPTATTAAELFATLPAGQTPLAEIWLAALLQLLAYFSILWALFALLARKKPQTLLRKKE